MRYLVPYYLMQLAAAYTGSKPKVRSKVIILTRGVSFIRIGKRPGGVVMNRYQ